jgi:Raf kinase inhibitor-like YbhB/YbcL family protein
MRIIASGLAGVLLAAACASGTGEPDGSDVTATALPPAETRPSNLAGYQPAFAGQTRAPTLQANAPVEVSEAATGLTNPFGFAFLPSGKILVTERPGALRVVGTDGKVSEPLAGTPTVAFNAQGGMLDVVLDPQFASNQTIYVSFAEPQADETNNTAVFSARFIDGPAPRLEDVKVIYHQTPSLKSPLHFGSRLVFAKDGTLFITQGERSIPAGRVQAEDLKSGLGKVVRINTDGTIPKDNPFVGNAAALPEIWSYGHRNVQGAFLHPKTGELWTIEHGPQGGDEINIARKGKDYGWPTITYGVEYGRANTKIGGGVTQQAGLEQPLYYWDPVVAPGGMTYYASKAIPKWTNSVFVAGLNSNYVARLTVKDDKVVGEERLTFSAKPERYRDIDVGPDGSLYLLTDGFAGTGRILKVSPSASGQTVGVQAWTPPAPPAAPAAPATPAPAANRTAPPAAGAALAGVTLPAKSGAKLTVTTPGWKEGEDIAFRYTQYQGNTFPGLDWTAGPAGTKSYAIIMQDPDISIRGTPILHWSMVNIPASVTKLEAGMAPEGKPAGSIYGPNYKGLAQPYLGPRTPPGPKDRYYFQIFALDVQLPADFAPKTYDELIAPMKDHVLASGSVMGQAYADPAAASARPATPANPG